MAVAVGETPIAANRCCHCTVAGWPARSPPPCSAAPGSTPCWSIRIRLSAGFPLRKARPRRRLQTLRDRPGRRGDVRFDRDREYWVARFGRMVGSGRATSAACSTTRWSTPCARKSRHATSSSTPRSRTSRPARSGRRSSCRTAKRSPRALSFWPPASTSACARSSASSARSSAPAIRSRIGFDVKPVGRPRVPFPALTYFAERPADRMAYITLFPIGTTMRANLFGYRDLHDPWLKQFRDAPQRDALCDVARPAPDDGRLRGARIRQDPSGRSLCHQRPPAGRRRAGRRRVRDIVPGGRHRRRKVLVDVERLCNVHIPRWLATPGMGEDKNRRVLRRSGQAACDALSIKKAYELRSLLGRSGAALVGMRRAKFVAHGAGACCGESLPTTTSS